ncbi:MAG TPA: AbrB/MazE/SpoVT family DNA-binding domain-containing protein, partial [Thermofilum sp.]|nr:AbrB/MazE/SpoVT family DNA-binding domain-containing protein [Thermofilum sp.]
MYIRVRVDGKGRITLPKKIREKMGIKKGDELVITLEREKLLISKIEDPFK